MNNTCAICGDATDHPEFWGRVTCVVCGGQPLVFEASCDTCDWSTRIEKTERTRGRAKQAAQREANSHEKRETIIGDGSDEHTTAVRELDG